MSDRDDDFLPPEDRCVYAYCQKSRAAHVGWKAGGPFHEFEEPNRGPKPERCVSAHIQTEWTCSHCGAECDVWGVAEEWMECDKCGRYSYLIPFMTQPQVEVSRDS